MVTVLAGKQTHRILDRSDFNLIFVEESDQEAIFGEIITFTIEHAYTLKEHANVSNFNCETLISEARSDCNFLNELLVFYNTLGTKAMNISKAYLNTIKELPSEPMKTNRTKRNIMEFGATQVQMTLLQNEISNLQISLQGDKSLLLQDIAIETKQLNNLYKHIRNTNAEIINLATKMTASDTLSFSRHQLYLSMFNAESIYANALNEHTMFVHCLSMIKTRKAITQNMITNETWAKIKETLIKINQLYGLSALSTEFNQIQNVMKAAVTQDCTNETCNLYITLDIPLEFEYNKSSFTYDGVYKIINVPHKYENFTRILDQNTPQRIQTQNDLISYVYEDDRTYIISFYKHTDCIANILENNIPAIRELCEFRLFSQHAIAQESLIHVAGVTYYLTTASNLTQICSAKDSRVWNINNPALIELRNECCSYQVNNQVIKQRSVCNINNTAIHPQINDVHYFPSDSELLFKLRFQNNTTGFNYSSIIENTHEEMNEIISNAKEAGISLSNLAYQIQNGHQKKKLWTLNHIDMLPIINTILIVTIFITGLRVLAHIHYVTAVVQHAIVHAPIQMDKLL